jgi:hypothetical protein
MKIELLGDNCRKCRLLRNNIELALSGCSASVEFQCVDEPKRFAEYGLLSLPGLAINGRILAEGKLLSSSAIVRMVETEN